MNSEQRLVNRRKLTKTTEVLQVERLVGDVGINEGEIKRAVAELTRIVGGINVILVQLDYEETDEGSDCRPEEQKLKGGQAQEGGKQPLSLIAQLRYKRRCLIPKRKNRA